MKRIDLIAGARPNFMKIAPLIDALQAAWQRGSSLTFRLIHTGQHYDRSMSGNFFDQLGIPEPDINLEVGSGTQAEQTANIMLRYEKVLLREKVDLCLVVGDVNSTMACAIVARKLGVDLSADDLPVLPPELDVGGNEMEGILVRALRLHETQPEGERRSFPEILTEVIADFRPSAHVERLELMDLLAVKECTDVRFLPQRFRNLDLDHLNRRITELRLRVGE